MPRGLAEPRGFSRGALGLGTEHFENLWPTDLLKITAFISSARGRNK